MNPYEMTFDAQLRRIHEITGARSQMELAASLGVRQAVVSDAKRRGRIPAEWLVLLFRAHNISPEWIMTGEGPCFLSPPSDHAATCEEPAVTLTEKEALRRLPSRMLADELVRRAAVAQQAAVPVPEK